ncbi:MAG: YqhA family protein, partial [Thermodesulfobacteriota bacterium]
MFKTIERVIERILWESRLIVFLAVVASIVSAMVLALMGSYDVWLVVKEMWHVMGDAEKYKEFHSTAITHIISAIDAYLIMTVLLIFGIGLYELFISKIDHLEGDSRSSRILVIHSLDQLKEKLAKV